MDNRLEDYTVLSVIGTGSFGTCYKVLKKETGEIFVWKAIDYGKMPEDKKKLLVSEVNLLSSLRHPNIVRYYDRILHKPSTTIYIIMEWCAGGDLSMLVKECKRTGTWLEEKFVWRVLYQMAGALHACHAHLSEGPVLHRDIKPANVFLDGNGNAKLGDFGLAYLLQVDSDGPSQGIVGTPYYMSPEAVHSCFYSPKSDVWSLGCLVYELCALHPPFDGPSLHRLMHNIKRAKFQRIPAHYSDELQSLLRWVLSAEQRARPSVEALLQHPHVLAPVLAGSLRSLCATQGPGPDSDPDPEPPPPPPPPPPQPPSSACSSASGSSAEAAMIAESRARQQDAQAQQAEQLRHWEAVLRAREVALAQRERAAARREKRAAMTEALAHERMARAEAFARHCQRDVCWSPGSDAGEQGDTSGPPATSARLSPSRVERPVSLQMAVAPAQPAAGRRVHFGALPTAPQPPAMLSKKRQPSTVAAEGPAVGSASLTRAWLQNKRALHQAVEKENQPPAAPSEGRCSSLARRFRSLHM